jgi:hypothetical protein
MKLLQRRLGPATFPTEHYQGRYIHVTVIVYSRAELCFGFSMRRCSDESDECYRESLIYVQVAT